MTCYHPIKGFRSKDRNPSGKRSIVVVPRDAHVDQPIELSCGQCIGCRLARSRSWALRILLESKSYPQNSFITLTYSDQFLPKDHSLNVQHFQKFMKRLRKANPSKRIRFFHCGEYGDLTCRPHYHACLFNHDFPDKHLWTIRNKENLYVSPELQRLWPYGHSSIGTLTLKSAAYVARYVLKKITGPEADWYYQSIDEETGEVLYDLKPEYTTMSRRPGIGRDWYEKFKSDAYPSDFIVVDGKKHRLPKFFDGQYEISNSSDLKKIKARRIVLAKRHASNNTVDRLRVREDLEYEKVSKLPRSLE